MRSSATLAIRHLSELAIAVFNDEDALVFTAYSEPEQEIRKIHGAEDLLSYARTILASDDSILHLAIQYPDSGPAPRIRKIDLDPGKCGGHNFRYSADGWGLIHLQCRRTSDDKMECRIVVNTKSRSQRWRDTCPELGDPREWDWQIVEKNARRLTRTMKKLEGSAR